jgi:putative transposase
MARHLRRQAYTVGRKRTRRLMAKMGLAPIYQRPRTTVPHPQHRVWPYLLRDLVIDRPNQVPRWSPDRRSCGRRIHGLLPMDGSQFTSPRFTGVLKEAGIRVSMDGRGRWLDNVFIGRFWRSLRYACVYLHAFETGSGLRTGLSRWIGYCNARRPHSSLAGRTPDQAYEAAGVERLAA